MSDTQALLDEIKKMQKAQDAAGLLGLENHGDKKVKKAARKAIHVLRSKGVEIPEQGRSWNQASLQDMRQVAGPIAMLDMSASPGVTRMTLSLPNDDQGAALFVTLLDPNQRMLDFAAYFQTDGQQKRTGRDWKRDADGRAVDTEWVRQRILWAREYTFNGGFEVPKSIDDHLPTLGQAPSERPDPAWLDAALAEVEAAPTSELSDALVAANVHGWPLLFDANSLFESLNEAMGDIEDPNSVTEEQRLERIGQAAAGNEALREALPGPFANTLDDVAVVFYLDGSLAQAKRIRQLAVDLRASETPETVDGVVHLVQLQITAAAMQQLRQGGGLPGMEEAPAAG